jgi:hypothetical protein
MNELQKELVELAIEHVTQNGGTVRVELCNNSHVDITFTNNKVVINTY